MTDLRQAIDLLSVGPLLNRISRHNADEFVEAVATVVEAARDYERRLTNAPLVEFKSSEPDNPNTWISRIVLARPGHYRLVKVEDWRTGI